MTQQKYMRPGLGFAVGKTVEELGELQAALGKTLRWGWNSYNPELPPNAIEFHHADGRVDRFRVPAKRRRRRRGG